MRLDFLVGEKNPSSIDPFIFKGGIEGKWSEDTSIFP